MTGSLFARSSWFKVHSLRRRLVLLLLAGILVVAAIQGTMAYRGATAQADAAFDYQMRQMALAFRMNGLANGIPRRPNETEDLDFVIQVWTEDGRRVYQSSSRRVVPATQARGFSIVKAENSTWRVYSIHHQGRSVQVAQDLKARASVARSMAWQSAAPVLFLVPFLMGLVWWAVTSSLAPVRQVRDQLESRAANDLQAVSEQGMPSEVRPLVQAFNSLLSRAESAFDGQRHFVANAAHELRTPLAALKLQLQNLRHAGPDLDRDKALETLEKGVNRAARLIDQLMALAREEAAAEDGRASESIDLAEAILRAVAERASQAEQRQIDLGAASVESLSVRGWSDALDMLTGNLLDNALKYTPAGGTIDVSVVSVDGAVELVIEDSGPGIEPAERERVLERFHRVPQASDSTDVPGSGLGLALVKTIADRHRAKLLLARSPRLGGLRVSVRFPAEKS
ncbi:MAG: ATP-binding protein [Burkholderiaceae bacterium]